MTLELPPLRFPYDALEPYIDAETMELHHDKHHQAYVDNLNKAIEPYPHLADLTIDDLLRHLDRVPDYLRAWWNVVAWDVVDERLRSFMRETGNTED
jgi:superoxide dismutase, Fe-Mn family